MSIKQKHLQQIVLPKDVRFADKLSKCMLKYMNNALVSETTEEYERWYKEFERCSQELLTLRKKKDEYEVSKSYRVI
ncbi:hypothetical protein WAJ07_21465, partial [Acinetobacter baumannii]